MLYGLSDNGDRVRAVKSGRAVCPHCGGRLVAKCGPIKVHHWAHGETKGCLYSTGMTEWHYRWLADYEGLKESGWEIEYFFEGVRFDAYNPETMQAIEFQRVIAASYIAGKIEACRRAGIKLFWMIGPEVFRNFAYADRFEDERCDVLFSPRRCRRAIQELLAEYVGREGVEFLIDFRDEDALPRYDADGFRTLSRNRYREGMEGDEHAMRPGLYRVYEMPLAGHGSVRRECVMKLKYHVRRYDFY